MDVTMPNTPEAKLLYMVSMFIPIYKKSPLRHLIQTAKTVVIGTGRKSGLLKLLTFIIRKN